MRKILSFRSRLFLVMCGTAVLGFLTGALLPLTEGRAFVVETAAVYFENLAQFPWQTAYLFCALPVLLAMVSGFYWHGYVLDASLLLFKSFHVAVLCSYYALKYGAAGILLSAVLIFPCASVSLVMLCTVATDAAEFSLQSRHFREAEYETEKNRFLLSGCTMVLFSCLCIPWTVLVNPHLEQWIRAAFGIF